MLWEQMHWEFGDPFVQNQKKIWTRLGKLVKDVTVGGLLLRVNLCMFLVLTHPKCTHGAVSSHLCCGAWGYIN